MSKKALERIQALQLETPSLSEKIEDSLVQLVGEPTQFFMVFFTKVDGKVMVSTAGWMEREFVADAPGYLMRALQTSGEGYVRLRSQHGSDLKQ